MVVLGCRFYDNQVRLGGLEAPGYRDRADFLALEPFNVPLSFWAGVAPESGEDYAFR